jgi:hypothetical protein
MIKAATLMPALLATAASAVAFDDRRYCAALGAAYTRFVDNDSRRPLVTGRVAVAECKDGDAAWAIPVLERKLVNARVRPPQRD